MPVALLRPLAITLLFLFVSITVIFPLLLEPTKMFPPLLSAICLGVSISSMNISTLKPSSTLRLFKIDALSAKKFREKVIINRYKKYL